MLQTESTGLIPKETFLKEGSPFINPIKIKMLRVRITPSLNLPHLLLKETSKPRILFEKDTITAVIPKQSTPIKTRNAVFSAVSSVLDLDKESAFKFSFEPSIEHHKAVAEGAHLALYSYKKPSNSVVESLESPEFSVGKVLAECQNIAKHIKNTPGNLMTPTIFASHAQKLLEPFEKATINVFDRKWAELQGMGAFCSVNNGSTQPLRFLEIIYKGNPEKPLIGLVGKGVTFDSGGISIKPSAGMAQMKGDLGGAAACLASIVAAAKLNLDLNLVCCIPLTENMPDGSSTKPGDVVVASNGKSYAELRNSRIEVDNTDAEGRLILADALVYICKQHKPTTLIELSTLTGAIQVALGSVYSAVFTRSDTLWNGLSKGGDEAGDPFWRMPMHETYSEQIKSDVADLRNVSSGKGGGSCTAAAFLSEFVSDVEEFAHVDIAGTMWQDGITGCCQKGMTGRPVRGLVEYLIAKNAERC